MSACKKWCLNHVDQRLINRATNNGLDDHDISARSHIASTSNYLIRIGTCGVHVCEMTEYGFMLLSVIFKHRQWTHEMDFMKFMMNLVCEK